MVLQSRHLFPAVLCKGMLNTCLVQASESLLKYLNRQNEYHCSRWSRFYKAGSRQEVTEIIAQHFRGSLLPGKAKEAQDWGFWGQFGNVSWVACPVRRSKGSQAAREVGAWGDAFQVLGTNRQFVFK
jgi:hypothetical protein